MDYAEKRKNAEIAARVDVNLEAAQSMARKRELDIPVFTGLSEAINQTGANLVFDVTIPAAHKQIVSTTLEMGCHIFGEKPMAESLEGAEELIKVVKKMDKKYSVM